MICTSCGVNNRDDAQFCRGCGTALGNPFQTPTPTQNPNVPPVPPPTATPSYPGYQSQFPQPPTYAGGGGYQAPLPAGPSGKAIASMILSIISIFTCGPLLSIPGMIIGKLEMNDIAAGRAPAAGLGYAKAGFWIGVVVTALSCLVGILYAVLIMLGIAGGALQS
ncbi:MAG: zinc-ribbon domain-containing protein [Blastocatellia bacterium]|nr:zinc-ribbon domain-containing protein [Blastocatellia bacterium]